MEFLAHQVNLFSQLVVHHLKTPVVKVAFYGICVCMYVCVYVCMCGVCACVCMCV